MDDLRAETEAADLLLMPSREEGFSIAGILAALQHVPRLRASAERFSGIKGRIWMHQPLPEVRFDAPFGAQ